MRQSFRYLTIGLSCLVLSLPAVSADEELFTLSDGERLSAMLPGEPGVEPPKPLVRTAFAPSYPAAAAGLNADTSVTLTVLVRDDGTVAEAGVLRAEHPGLGFEEAALNQIRDWRYRPARHQGQPVNAITVVRMRFPQPGTRTGELGRVPAFAGGIPLVIPGGVANGLPGAKGEVRLPVAPRPSAQVSVMTPVGRTGGRAQAGSLRRLDRPSNPPYVSSKLSKR